MAAAVEQQQLMNCSQNGRAMLVCHDWHGHDQIGSDGTKRDTEAESSNVTPVLWAIV